MQLLPLKAISQGQEEQRYEKYKEFFNQFSEGFPEQYARFDSKHFVEFSSLNEEDEVLEIGVGAGYTPEYILPRTSQSVFIDFDMKAAVTQKSRYRDVQVFVADALQMPFQKSSFTKVLARYTIHNLPSHHLRTQFFTECRRILEL